MSAYDEGLSKLVSFVDDVTPATMDGLNNVEAILYDFYENLGLDIENNSDGIPAAELEPVNWLVDAQKSINGALSNLHRAKEAALNILYDHSLDTAHGQ